MAACLSYSFVSSTVVLQHADAFSIMSQQVCWSQCIPVHPDSWKCYLNPKDSHQSLPHLVAMNSQILVRRRSQQGVQGLSWNMELGHPFFLVWASWCLEMWVEKGKWVIWNSLVVGDRLSLGTSFWAWAWSKIPTFQQKISLTSSNKNR